MTRTALLAAPLAAALLGGLAAAPADAATTRDFTRSFTDTCTVLGRSWAVPAVVSGTVPVSARRGTSFRLSDLVFSARVPAELATQAYDVGARRAVLRISVVEARGVGVLPAVRDVLSTDVTTGRLVVRRGQPLAFRAPATGTVATSFTAGSTAGTARLQAGAVRATITLLDGSGAVVVRDEPVTCAVPSPAVTVTTLRIT